MMKFKFVCSLLSTWALAFKFTNISFIVDSKSVVIILETAFVPSRPIKVFKPGKHDLLIIAQNVHLYQIIIYLLFKYHNKHEDEDIQAQRSQQVWQKGPKSDLSEVQILTILQILSHIHL